jgi:inositol transport system ATP-binding protein
MEMEDMADEFLLEMKGIRKTFPGVVALDDVDLEVRPGTVHALMGENGAGKSTLMKVLIGMYAEDSGTITFDGQQVKIPDTKTGLGMGISMIHQELAPVPEMTVAENIYLGREPRNALGLVGRRQMVVDAQAVLDEWGIKIDPRAQLKHLSVAQQQMVEIAKAVSYDAKLVIMDEPTSAITEREVAHLHEMIKQAHGARRRDHLHHPQDGRGLQDLGLRDDLPRRQAHPDAARGRAGPGQAHHPHGGTRADQPLPQGGRRDRRGHAVRANLNRGPLVRDVSFEVRRGEILGVAGLMGAGRTEVLETIFGMYPAESGEIVVHGKTVKIGSPADAIKNDLALLTEDRKATGIMGVLSVRDNMIAAALPKYSPKGLLQRGRIKTDTEAQRAALRVKTPSLDQLIQNLSGGNQQKALIARWMLTLPDILMIDEPTRGIDVGAKSEIHRLMSKLAQSGKAVIMVSSEMPEILGMSDRIIVMHEGQVTGELSRAEATQEKIMQLATASAVVSV